MTTVGRKKSMLINDFVIILGGLLSIIVNTPCILIGRFANIQLL